MRLTARRVNNMIKTAERIGKYVYAKTPELFPALHFLRIVGAKTIDGRLYGKVLSSGKWEEILDSRIEVR